MLFPPPRPLTSAPVPQPEPAFTPCEVPAGKQAGRSFL